MGGDIYLLFIFIVFVDVWDWLVVNFKFGGLIEFDVVVGGIVIGVVIVLIIVLCFYNVGMI